MKFPRAIAFPCANLLSLLASLAFMIWSPWVKAECALVASDSARYLLCDQALNWSDAQAHCAALGLALADAHTDVGPSWLAATIQAHGGGARWVGSLEWTGAGGSAPNAGWCEGEPAVGACAALDGTCLRSADCAEPLGFVCQGGCDDQNVCTVDSLDTGTASCVFTSFSGGCDDGDACTTGEQCAGASAALVDASPLLGALSCAGSEATSPPCDALSFQPYLNAGNLALKADGGAAPAVTSSTFLDGALEAHQPHHLNDGSYGNGSSWIPAAAGSWAKIDLGATHLIGGIRLGRDRLAKFEDRPTGRVTIRVALTDAAYIQGNDTDDALEYSLIFDSAMSGYSGELGPAETVQFAFGGTPARFVKVEFESEDVAIDEIEVLAATGLACAGGAPVGCDDSNDCTLDTCDPGQGCINAETPGPCDDGDGCTTNDACAAGTCAGAPLVCEDNDECTTASCEDAAGCVFTLHATPECSFGVHTVSPTATELGVVRDFTMRGAGLGSVTNVEITGMVVDSWTMDATGALIVTAQTPSIAGMHSIVVHGPGEPASASLEAAIASVGSGFCAGSWCGVCDADLDCIDGDPCSVDHCGSGLCKNLPSESCCPEAGCGACAVAGDIDGSGATTILDIQCTILTTLWVIGGKTDPLPACIHVPLASLDHNCDKSVSVADLLSAINSALGVPLHPTVDADADGCADVCVSPAAIDCGPPVVVGTSSLGGATCAANAAPKVPGADVCAPSLLSLTAPGSASAQCTAQHVDGSESTCTHTFTLVDDVAPSIVCGTTPVAECTGPCATTVLPTTSATDACSDVVVACGETGQTDTFCRGATPVTCTATDAAGNSASCLGSVTVVDTLPPTALCNAITYGALDQDGLSVVPKIVKQAFDQCDTDEALVIAQTPPIGTVVPSGDHSVVAQVTDISGNTATCEGVFRASGLAVLAPPYGYVFVPEDAGEVNGNPCRSGLAPEPFPGTQAPVVVTACFAPDGVTVVSIDFRATVHLAPLGSVELKGQYDAASQSLCLTGTSELQLGTGAAVAVSALEVTACLGQGGTTLPTVTYQGLVGTDLGALVVSGGFSPQTGLLCMSGALDVSLLAGSAMSGEVELCLEFGGGSSISVASAEFSATALLPPFGVAHLTGHLGSGGETCLLGQVVGNPNEWLPVVGFSILDLTAKACGGGAGFGLVELQGTAQLGQGNGKALLTLDGTLSGSEGLDFSLALDSGCQTAGCAWVKGCSESAKCDATWRPFMDLVEPSNGLHNLAFSELSGTLGVHADGVNLDLVANLDAQAQVPLSGQIELEEASVGAHFRSGGGGALEAGVYLAGTVRVPLATETLVLTVSGEVTPEHIAFDGTVTTESGSTAITPLPGFQGPEPFQLDLEDASATLLVDFGDGTVAAEILAGATFSIFELTLDAAMQITFDKTEEDGWAFVATAFLQHLDIPLGNFTLKLGDYGLIAVAIASKGIENYPIDEDGDPSNGKESTIELTTGINLIARADLTFLDGLIPGIRTTVFVRLKSPSSMSVTGRLDFPLTLIKPEYNIPSVHSLAFKRLEVAIKRQNTLIELRVGGAMTFVPAGQFDGPKAPIDAYANLLVDIKPFLAFGGEIYVDGIWESPLFWADFKLLNPGLLAKFHFVVAGPSLIPVPVSLGANGQVFYRKSGEWPEEIELDDQNFPINLPPNILTAGATFFYEVALTSSGICVPFSLNLKCAKLPTIIARIDLENFQLQDFVNLADSYRGLGVALASIPGLESLHAALPPGALVPLDVSPLEIKLNRVSAYLSTHNTRRFGLDFTAGIRVIADGSVTDLIGQKHDALFDGFLHPKGLDLTAQISPIDFIPGLEIVGDPYRREASLNGGAVAVPHSEPLAGARTIEGWLHSNAAGTFADKSDGLNGFELAIGPLAPAVCDDAEAAACPNEFSVIARVYNNGAVRELVSEDGVVGQNERHHIALTFDEEGLATLFVDGSAVPTSDSLPGLLPGVSEAPLTLGEGLTRIDNVRVWTMARTAAELKGDSRISPWALRLDPALALWLEFDYDHVYGSTTAYNSRVGSVAGDGAYVGGASSTYEPANQDLFLKLSFGIENLLGSFLWFRVGLSADLDWMLPGAMFSASAEAALGDGQANGTLYVKDLPLLGIPGVGGIYITGNGPNAVKGDFDDGLYLSGDLTKDPFPTLNASGRLLVEDEFGVIKEVADAAILLDCLAPAGCDSVLDYTPIFQTGPARS